MVAIAERMVRRQWSWFICMLCLMASWVSARSCKTSVTRSMLRYSGWSFKSTDAPTYFLGCSARQANISEQITGTSTRSTCQLCLSTPSAKIRRATSAARMPRDLLSIPSPWAVTVTNWFCRTFSSGSRSCLSDIRRKILYARLVARARTVRM